MINIDDEDFLVPLYLRKKPASATVLLPQEQVKHIMDAYGVKGIPTNVLIDKTGTVRNWSAGFGMRTEKDLRGWIDAALGNSAAPAGKSK
jgi:hypothetical protein